MYDDATIRHDQWAWHGAHLRLTAFCYYQWRQRGIALSVNCRGGANTRLSRASARRPGGAFAHRHDCFDALNCGTSARHRRSILEKRSNECQADDAILRGGRNFGVSMLYVVAASPLPRFLEVEARGIDGENAGVNRKPHRRCAERLWLWAKT